MPRLTKSPFTKNEKRAVISLSGIFSLRMFGLFMLLPILSIYAGELQGASPLLIGLALGAYGLTQAIFQIPFGILSDRFNRKYIIAIGLLIFSIGSLIAGTSDSILGLIVGRTIQGTGAISAAILALTADLTRSDQRTKSMAIIGVSIGFTFMLSLILAPILQSIIGVNGLFFTVAVLGLLAIWVLFKYVPKVSNEKLPASSYGDSNVIVSELIATAINPRLIQLNCGIFISHLLLTMLFLVIPSIIVEIGGYALETHWQVYVPILLLSALGMVPLIRAASKRTHVSMAYRIGILLVLISFTVLSFSSSHSFLWVWVGMVVFFSGFNALEAMLPSLVSQQVPSQVRGMAMGVYNTFQFSGIFIGGVFGGWIMGLFGRYSVMAFALGIAAVWLVLSLLLPKFHLTRSISVNLDPMNDSQKDQLIDKIKHLEGIRDISIIGVDPVLYLEVEDELYNDTELQQLIRT